MELFMYVCSVLLLLFSKTETVSTEEIKLDGNEMRQVLIDLAEKSLHLNKIQESLDKEIEYETPITPNGYDILQRIVDNGVEPRFRALESAVENLRDSVEETLNEAGGLFEDDGVVELHEECCRATNLESDNRFPDLEVNPNNVCTVGTGTNTAEARYPKKDKILQASRENLNNIKELKWQYTGFEWNYVINFPAAKICLPDYKPTLRSWYKESASAVPVDLVIVFDISKSMGDLGEIKDAIRTVMDTLGPNDRVAVVRFNNEAETPHKNSDVGSECYASELALAVPENTEFLLDFVERSRPSGGSAYIPAFRKAFSFFQPKEEVEEEREYVILFVSDGEAATESKEDILDTIKEENLRLQNEVVIHTFGYRIDNPEDDLHQVQLLQDIAKQDNNDNTYDTQKGRYSTVETEDLRETLARFYNGPSNEPGSEVVYTVPYHDGFGFGMVISACLPVRQHPRTFMGVTCIDMLMIDLIGELTEFQSGKGEVLYPFMLDKHGRYVYHPLLPEPAFDKDPPVYTEFSALEPDSNVIRYVKGPMLRGDEGYKDLSVDHVKPRGSKARSGIDTKVERVTYYYKPVSTSGYSVCVVIGQNEQYRNIKQGTFPDKVYYHRTDLSPDRPARCKSFDRVVYKEPVVHLTAKAFQDPGTFYNLRDIDDIFVQYIEDYLEGGNRNTKGVLEPVRNTVTAFYKLYKEEIMDNDEGNEYTFWRYIGTVDGVFLTDHRMPSSFDHLVRPWFVEARVHKGDLSVSEFYHDATTNKLVVTLAKTVFAERSEHNSDSVEDEQTLAVVAMDFTLPQMYHQLLTAYPKCTSSEFKCMIVNENGVLILHTDFMEVPTENLNDIMSLHLTKKEHKISRDLIADRIMQTSSCRNCKTLKTQNFWKIKMPGTQNKVVRDYFTMAEVTGTNVFIIIRYADVRGGTDCHCRSNPDESQTAECLSDPEQSGDDWCECPCYTTTSEFDFCKYQLDSSQISDAAKPCVPDQPKPNFENVTKMEMHTIPSLSECFPIECDVTSRWACEGRSGCAWCDEKTCKPLTDCPTHPDYIKPGGGTSMGVIGGIIACVLVIAIAVAVIVFVLYRRRKQTRTPPTPSMIGLHQGTPPSASEYMAPNPNPVSPVPDVTLIPTDLADRPPAPPPPFNLDNNARVFVHNTAQPLSNSNPSIHTPQVHTNGFNREIRSTPVNYRNNQYENYDNDAQRISEASSSQTPSQNSTVRGAHMQAANFENIF